MVRKSDVLDFVACLRALTADYGPTELKRSGIPKVGHYVARFELTYPGIRN